MESNIKKPLPVGSDAVLAPFVLWGDRYYGLCVQDGSVTTEPDQKKDWKEYHLDYRGGDIWEIEVCPSENTGWTVWRGKLPSREVFVTIMQNIEDAPPIDWANDKDQATRQGHAANTQHVE
jgi:hypothetical protein